MGAAPGYRAASGYQPRHAGELPARLYFQNRRRHGLSRGRTDQSEEIYNPGYYKVGRGKPIRDQAPPGRYDFRRALKLSSNTYFITQGLRVGPAKIVRVGQRLHLGERTGLATRQEVSGNFPSLQQVSSKWSDGNTANLCIGQGEIDVTPLQMAVLTSAIANGGKVWWPRLVARVQTQDPFSTEPPGRVSLRPATR